MKLYFKTIPTNITTCQFSKPSISNIIILYSSTGIYESDYKLIVSDKSVEEYTFNNVLFIKDESTYTKTKVHRIPFEHMKLELTKYSYFLSKTLKLVIMYRNDTVYNIFYETNHLNTDLALIKNSLLFIK